MEADKQEKTDNELIAEFMGYEFGVVNYYGQKDETEFQRKYEKVFDEIGLDSIGNYFFNPTTKDFFLKVEANNYRIKWDWLMPVVEKISLMKWEFETESVDHEAEPDDDGSLPIIRTKEYDFHYPRTFGMVERDTKQFMFRFNPGSLFIEDRLIDAAYKAVVEFIKFYNSQKPLPL